MFLKHRWGLCQGVAQNAGKINPSWIHYSCFCQVQFKFFSIGSNCSSRLLSIFKISQITTVTIHFFSMYLQRPWGANHQLLHAKTFEPKKVIFFWAFKIKLTIWFLYVHCKQHQLGLWIDNNSQNQFVSPEKWIDLILFFLLFCFHSFDFLN